MWSLLNLLQGEDARGSAAADQSKAPPPRSPQAPPQAPLVARPQSPAVKPRSSSLAANAAASPASSPPSRLVDPVGCASEDAARSRSSERLVSTAYGRTGSQPPDDRSPAASQPSSSAPQPPIISDRAAFVVETVASLPDITVTDFTEIDLEDSQNREVACEAGSNAGSADVSAPPSPRGAFAEADLPRPPSPLLFTPVVEAASLLWPESSGYGATAASSASPKSGFVTAPSSPSVSAADVFQSEKAPTAPTHAAQETAIAESHPPAASDQADGIAGVSNSLSAALVLCVDHLRARAESARKAPRRRSRTVDDLDTIDAKRVESIITLSLADDLSRTSETLTHIARDSRWSAASNRASVAVAEPKDDAAQLDAGSDDAFAPQALVKLVMRNSAAKTRPSPLESQSSQADVASRIAELEACIARLEAQAEAERSQHASQLASLQTEMHEKVSAAADAAAASTADLESKVATLTLERDAGRATAARLVADLADKERVIQDTAASNALLAVERGRLACDLEASQAMLHDAQGVIVSLQQGKAEAEETAAKLECRVKDLESANQQAVERGDELEQHNAVLQSRIESLEAQAIAAQRAPASTQEGEDAPATAAPLKLEHAEAAEAAEATAAAVRDFEITLRELVIAQERIRYLETEYMQRNDELMELTVQYEQKGCQIAEFHEELAKHDQLFAAVVARLESNEAQREQAVAELECVRASEREAVEAARQTQARVEELENSVAKAVEERDSLVASNVKAVADAKQAAADLDAARAKIDEHLAQLKRCHAKIKEQAAKIETERAAAKACAKDSEDAKAMLAERDAGLAQARECVDAKSAEIAVREEKLQAQAVQISEVSARVSELESQLASKEEELAGKAVQINAQAKEIDSLKVDIAGKIDKIKKCGAKIALQNEVLAREKAKEAALLDEIESLKQAAQTHKSESESVVEQVKVLTAQIASHDEELDRRASGIIELEQSLDAGRKELDNCRAKLALQDKEVEKCRSRIEQQGKKLHETHTKMQALHAAKTLLEKNVGELESANSRAEAAAAEVAKERDSLVASNGKAVADAKQAADDLEAARAKIDEHLAQLKRCHARIKEQAAKIETERAAAKACAKDAEDAKAMLAERDVGLAQARECADAKSAEIAVCEEKLQAQAVQISEVSARVSELESQLASKEEELAGKAVQINAQAKEIDSLKAEASDTAMSLESRDSQISDLTSQLADAGAQIDSLTSQLDTLTNKLAETREEHSAIKGMLEAQMREISNLLAEKSCEMVELQERFSTADGHRARLCKRIASAARRITLAGEVPPMPGVPELRVDMAPDGLDAVESVPDEASGLQDVEEEREQRNGGTTTDTESSSADDSRNDSEIGVEDADDLSPSQAEQSQNGGSDVIYAYESASNVGADEQQRASEASTVPDDGDGADGDAQGSLMQRCPSTIVRDHTEEAADPATKARISMPRGSVPLLRARRRQPAAESIEGSLALLDQIEAEVAEARARAAQVSAEAAEEVQMFRERVALLETALDAKQQSVHDVEEQRETLKADLEREAARVAALQGDLAKAMAELSESSKMADGLREQIASEQSHVAMLECKVAGIQSQSDGLAAKLMETKRQHVDAVGKLSDALAAAEAAAAAAAERAERSKAELAEKLDGAVDSLNIAVTRLEDDLRETRDKAAAAALASGAEITSLRKQHLDAETQLQVCRDLLDGAEQVVSDLAIQAGLEDMLRENLEAKSHQLVVAHTHMGNLEAACAASKQRVAQIQAELDAATLHARDTAAAGLVHQALAEVALDKLAAERRCHQIAQQVADARRSRLHEMANALADVQDQLADTRAVVSLQLKSASDSANVHGKLDDIMARLDAQRQADRDTIMQLKEANAELQVTTVELMERVAAHAGELGNLRREYATLEASRRSEQIEHDVSMERAEQVRERLTREASVLEARVRELKAENAHLHETVAELSRRQEQVGQADAVVLSRPVHSQLAKTEPAGLACDELQACIPTLARSAVGKVKEIVDKIEESTKPGASVDTPAQSPGKKSSKLASAIGAMRYDDKINGVMFGDLVSREETQVDLATAPQQTVFPQPPLTVRNMHVVEHRTIEPKILDEHDQHGSFEASPAPEYGGPSAASPRADPLLMAHFGLAGGPRIPRSRSSRKPDAALVKFGTTKPGGKQQTYVVEDVEEAVLDRAVDQALAQALCDKSSAPGASITAAVAALQRIERESSTGAAGPGADARRSSVGSLWRRIAGMGRAASGRADAAAEPRSVPQPAAPAKQGGAMGLVQRLFKDASAPQLRGTSAQTRPRLDAAASAHALGQTADSHAVLDDASHAASTDPLAAGAHTPDGESWEGFLKRCEQLKQQHLQSLADREAWVAERTQLLHDLEEVKVAHKRSADEVRGLLQTVLKLETDKIVLESALRSVSALRKRSKDKIARLEGDLESSAAEVERAHGAIEALEAEAEVLRTQLREAGQMHEQVQGRMQLVAAETLKLWSVIGSQPPPGEPLSRSAIRATTPSGDAAGAAAQSARASVSLGEGNGADLASGDAIDSALVSLRAVAAEMGRIMVGVRQRDEFVEEQARVLRLVEAAHTETHNEYQRALEERDKFVAVQRRAVKQLEDNLEVQTREYARMLGERDATIQRLRRAAGKLQAMRILRVGAHSLRARHGAAAVSGPVEAAGDIESDSSESESAEQ
ncbi:hypothetical protein HK105_206683 [Polyrhizophydium stewartii]|uniref:Uncharacterized protein n=1 Tax=Polyrhizophydium stewartii TaxID=2732419 RepID=A0ABR4N2R9_9FUNG